MKSNQQNYKDLEAYLAREDIEYEKLSPHHYRILGPSAIVDVYPARMTCRVIQTEGVDPNSYFRLKYHFNEKQLTAVLNGEEWRKS